MSEPADVVECAPIGTFAYRCTTSGCGQRFGDDFAAAHSHRKTGHSIDVARIGGWTPAQLARLKKLAAAC